MLATPSAASSIVPLSMSLVICACHKRGQNRHVGRREASSHLADSNGFALITEREATELWVVRELLYTYRLSSLYERNDLLPPLSKLWWLPGLATRSLVEVVKESLVDR